MHSVFKSNPVSNLQKHLRINSKVLKNKVFQKNMDTARNRISLCCGLCFSPIRPQGGSRVIRVKGDVSSEDGLCANSALCSFENNNFQVLVLNLPSRQLYVKVLFSKSQVALTIDYSIKCLFCFFPAIHYSGHFDAQTPALSICRKWRQDLNESLQRTVDHWFLPGCSALMAPPMQTPPQHWPRTQMRLSDERHSACSEVWVGLCFMKRLKRVTGF